jgi:hypothetical protein
MSHLKILKAIFKLNGSHPPRREPRPRETMRSDLTSQSVRVTPGHKTGYQTGWYNGWYGYCTMALAGRTLIYKYEKKSKYPENKVKTNCNLNVRRSCTGRRLERGEVSFQQNTFYRGLEIGKPFKRPIVVLAFLCVLPIPTVRVLLLCQLCRTHN